MSAFRPKADVADASRLCPFVAKSRHSNLLIHACRQQNCVRSIGKSVEMTIRGGKYGNVGSFGGQNAVSVFSGVGNRTIMRSKLGGWAFHPRNVGGINASINRKFWRERECSGRDYPFNTAFLSEVC